MALRTELPIVIVFYTSVLPFALTVDMQNLVCLNSWHAKFVSQLSV